MRGVTSSIDFNHVSPPPWPWLEEVELVIISPVELVPPWLESVEHELNLYHHGLNWGGVEQWMTTHFS